MHVPGRLRMLREVLLGITLILGLPENGGGQPSPQGGTDTLDPALRSIVRLIIDQPDEDDVVVRAVQWATNQQRLLELLETVLTEARRSNSDALFHFCAQYALQAKDPLRAISILEEGCSTPDSQRCPHALGRLWLEGGWVEAARSIHIEYGVDPFAEFILRLMSGEQMAETLPAMAPKDRDFLIQVFSRLNLCTEGADFFESAGDLQAALSVLIRCADLPRIERLLALHNGLDLNSPPNEIFPLARLRGKLPRDQFVPRNLKSMWNSSMGFGEPESLSTGSDMRLSRLFQSLNLACTNGESLLARKIWISIERQLPPMTPYPSMNPRWREVLGQALASWADPSQVAQQMGDVRDPEAASICRRAILYTNPGTLTEARLWFHAGRLSQSIAELERALRIAPEARFRRPTAIENVSVTATLPEAILPLPVPGPVAIQTVKPGIIGDLDQNSIRVPAIDRSTEEWYLSDWSIAENLPSKVTPIADTGGDDPSSFMSLNFRGTEGDPLKIVGDRHRWSVRLAGEPGTSLHASRGASLFDESGLPRIDLLGMLIDPCPEHLNTHAEWDKWPNSIQGFAEACGRYLRDPESAKHGRVQEETGKILVKVGPITGVFQKTAPETESEPFAHSSFAQLRFPNTEAGDSTSQRWLSPEGTPFTARAVLEFESPSTPANRGGILADEILLPAGEDLLTTRGSGDRLVVTRSGLVGWIPQGGWIANEWFHLLDPPLPGKTGFPRLPLEVHPPQQTWANSETPRVRETRCPDGSVFLVIGDPLLRFDSQGPQPLEWPHSLSGECTSAQLLDREGKIPNSISDPLFPWFIDAQGKHLHGPSFQQPMPEEGAYAIHGHTRGPLVLGQHRGETWLALWNGDDWEPLPLPPLPGERDRPYLRAAAIEVVGTKIYLIADRLWLLSPSQSPRPLIPPPAPGAYRAVHWVQPPPQVFRHQIVIQRPWGVDQVWRFDDE